MAKAYPGVVGPQESAGGGTCFLSRLGRCVSWRRRRVTTVSNRRRGRALVLTCAIRLPPIGSHERTAAAKRTQCKESHGIGDDGRPFLLCGALAAADVAG